MTSSQDDESWVSISQAGEMPPMPVGLMQKDFVDPQTGQIIPHETILKNLEILDQIQATFGKAQRFTTESSMKLLVLMRKRGPLQ